MHGAGCDHVTRRNTTTRTVSWSSATGLMLHIGENMLYTEHSTHTHSKAMQTPGGVQGRKEGRPRTASND